MLSYVTALVAAAASASASPPLGPDEVRAWHEGRVAGDAVPVMLQRLAAYRDGRGLEAAGTIEAAVARLAPHAHGDDPLAVAIRFHAARLWLELGRDPSPGSRNLFEAPRGSVVRWGISRRDEAEALGALAAAWEGQVRTKDAAGLRAHLALEYPRWSTAVEGLSWYQRRTRARNLLRDMDYAGGIAALQALDADAPSSERVRLRKEIATAIAKKRRSGYAGAAEIYEELTSGQRPSIEDLDFYAYILGKYDEDGSQEVYRQIAQRAPGTTYGRKAAFFVAWTEMDLGRIEEAVAAFNGFLKSYPSGGYSGVVRWYRGLCLAQLGRWEEALPDLTYSERYGSEPERGVYWTARALAVLGRTAEANARWARLASDPFSFYGMLSRMRLPEEDRPPLFAQASVPAWLVGGDASVLRSSRLPEDAVRGVEEARAAMQVGDYELARQMLAYWSDRAVRGRAPALLDALRPQAADYGRLARSSAARRCKPYLGVDPSDPAARECWARLYPTAYQPLIEQSRGDVPAELFWAIMRQESYYDPQARSHADALGLMQLIPQVAEPVFESRGEPFDPYQLYLPEVNVPVFAAAMGEYFERFAGHEPLVLMAYNSTPERADAWLRANRDLPFDLFVERISYGETRDYVKRVSAHLARYRTLQGAEGELVSRAGLPMPDTVAREAFAAVYARLDAEQTASQ